MIKLKSKIDPDAIFYIQSHGLHAGRPLRKSIPNSFSVYSDEEFAFEIVEGLFIAGKFKNLILGSVIPFIRISETQKMLNHFFAIPIEENKIKNISNLLIIQSTMNKKQKVMDKLILMYCKSLFNTF